MTFTDAYLHGFRKAAGAAGLNPAALVKVALLGELKSIGTALKATGNAIKAVAPAARNAWNAGKSTTELGKATAAAGKAWNAVPGIKKMTNTVKTVGKIPGVRTAAKYGIPAAAVFGLGRASVGGTDEQTPQDPAGNMMGQQGFYANPDVLSQFRTNSDENIARVFNFKPYIPRWEQELLNKNNGQ